MVSYHGTGVFSLSFWRNRAEISWMRRDQKKSSFENTESSNSHDKLVFLLGSHVEIVNVQLKFRSTG